VDQAVEAPGLGLPKQLPPLVRNPPGHPAPFGMASRPGPTCDTGPAPLLSIGWGPHLASHRAWQESTAICLRVCSGPCKGRQPLSSSLQLKGSQCLRKCKGMAAPPPVRRPGELRTLEIRWKRLTSADQGPMSNQTAFFHLQPFLSSVSDPLSYPPT
jgi:hypothetical protein